MINILRCLFTIEKETMNILKRFLNWLFGKHWGYTKKEIQQFEKPVVYEGSVEQFKDLQVVAKIEPVGEVVKDAIIEERQKKTTYDNTPNPNKYWRRFKRGDKLYWKKYYL